MTTEELRHTPPCPVAQMTKAPRRSTRMWCDSWPLPHAPGLRFTPGLPYRNLARARTVAEAREDSARARPGGVRYSALNSHTTSGGVSSGKLSVPAHGSVVRARAMPFVWLGALGAWRRTAVPASVSVSPQCPGACGSGSGVVRTCLDSLAFGRFSGAYAARRADGYRRSIGHRSWLVGHGGYATNGRATRVRVARRPGHSFG